MASAILNEMESLLEQMDETPGTCLIPQFVVLMQQLVQYQQAMFAPEIARLERVQRRLLFHRQLLVNSFHRRIQLVQWVQQAEEENKKIVEREE